MQVAHAGGAGSTTLLQAGGDLTLDAVRTGRSQSIVWDADNHLKASQSQDVGTTVQAAGDIALKAGGDISGRAATVSSSAGAVTADGRDVKLAAGESSSSFDQAQRHTSSGFLSSTTIASRTTSDQTKAVASELSGRTVTINASRDVAVKGSNVLSDAGTAITAGRNVDITLGTRSQSSAQKQAGTPRSQRPLCSDKAPARTVAPGHRASGANPGASMATALSNMKTAAGCVFRRIR
ncbi:hemagglutinin repeat-containing protein [Amphibiibacter pelophylacis]|uniref:Hemagglutinin repeat-containing protein n=1 Tax=Amphibiibacter pelophylacis TaxID=1799477 RepID=A0ACC6P459_9BURK